MVLKRFRMGYVGGFVLGGLLMVNGTWIHAKTWLAQILIKQAWTETLGGEHEVRPWPWADTWPVAKLSTEAAEIELYVLSGATGNPLAFAPGHYLGTALPGMMGTSVIAGHRDTHFRFLENIEVNEELWIENPQGKRARYLISDKQVVDSRIETMRIDNRSTQLKLVTCYPFDAINPGGPMRMVVTASLAG